MKTLVFLSVVQLALSAGILPQPQPNGLISQIPNIIQSVLVRNPNACVFNEPQGSATLQGQNFIENFGTGSCLTFKKNGPQNMPIELESCTWNSLPMSSQLYNFRNGNGGIVLKPTVSGVFGAETCLTTTRFGERLSGERCSSHGKDFDQTWRFTRVRGNQYQITQMSSGKCLRSDSTRTGAPVSLERCNFLDNFQVWRICTSK